MSIDLTALTATAVASVKIEHEDWCCAVGCACYPVRHAGTEADCSCLRLSIVAAARAAVEAAAPLIEAAVREQIATSAVRAIIGHHRLDNGWDIASPHHAGQPWRAYWMCICGTGGTVDRPTCAESEKGRGEAFAEHLAEKVTAVIARGAA